MALNYDDIDPGPGAHWGRAPRIEHGVANGDGRRVLHVRGRHWRYEPERCPAASLDTVPYDRILVCAGCGLDVT